MQSCMDIHESYQGILFDLDGTLVTTDYEHRHSLLAETFSTLGIRQNLARDAVDRFWFCGERDAFLHVRWNIDPSLFWPVFNHCDVVEMRLAYTRPFDDVPVLSDFRRAGYKLGVVTGAARHIAQLEVEMVHKKCGESCFEVIVAAGYDGETRPKPHPDGLFVGAARHALAPEQAVYVGNAPEDVQAAHAASMASVLLDRGEYHHPEFSNGLQPTYCFSTLHEMQNHFRRKV